MGNEVKEGKFLHQSPYDILEQGPVGLLEDESGSTVLFNHVKKLVAALQGPEYASLIKTPFSEWSHPLKISLVAHEPMVIKLLDEVAPQVITQEMADAVFDKSGIIALVPEQMRSQEHWIQHLISGGFMGTNSGAQHLRTEAFWMEAIERAPNYHDFGYAIKPEEQTQRIVDKLAGMDEQNIDIRDIRSDLLSDSVVGKIMQRSIMLHWVDEETLLRGMRWLLDNGRRTSLEASRDGKGARGPRFLLEIYRRLNNQERNVDRGNALRYYQAIEELRAYPAKELARHVAEPADVELFRKLHGRQLSVELLGDRLDGHKRKWLEQELGL